MSQEPRERVRKELRDRKPRVIQRSVLESCPRSEYIGRFPKESDYDEVIREDCDVFVDGVKVVAFRKELLPFLKEGSKKCPEVWEFFRKTSREVYGTQRGVVAGTEYTTKPYLRLTKGQVAFFVQASAGLLTTVKQAREILASSDEYTVKLIKVHKIKETFPEIGPELLKLDREFRRKDLSSEEEDLLTQRKRQLLWSWFDSWLENDWASAPDKAQFTREVAENFLSGQQNFNHCYSNVLGAIDRGSRFPYGRLSGTAQRNYEGFERYQSVYASACEGFRQSFPEIWENVRKVISQVKDPSYNLFGTAFTSITLNFNFRTAYHVDKNNLKGALAVLSTITQGEYDGHFLVFPELRLAFDLRDGDFIVGDTQTLLHGNTEMTKISEDAERISLVFYSREDMTRLESLDCESCRRDFLKFSLENLSEKSKKHDRWRGVWPNMWVSLEWLEYRKSRGMEQCSNSNWRSSRPYQNVETGEVKLFKNKPNGKWVHLEVLPELATE